MTGCKKCTTERLTWDKNGEGLMTVVKDCMDQPFKKLEITFLKITLEEVSVFETHTHSPDKSLYVRDKAGNKYRIFTYKKTNMILSWGLLLSDFSERKEIVAAST